MEAAEACDLAELVLARAGLTAAEFAEARGLVTAGVPTLLLWTEDEAAAALQVSPRTLRRLAEDDAGVAACRRKLRGAVRYHAGMLAEWAERGAGRGGAAE